MKVFLESGYPRIEGIPLRVAEEQPSAPVLPPTKTKRKIIPYRPGGVDLRSGMVRNTRRLWPTLPQLYYRLVGEYKRIQTTRRFPSF